MVFRYQFQALRATAGNRLGTFHNSAIGSLEGIDSRSSSAGTLACRRASRTGRPVTAGHSYRVSKLPQTDIFGICCYLEIGLMDGAKL